MPPGRGKAVTFLGLGHDILELIFALAYRCAIDFTDLTMSFSTIELTVIAW